jgi:hypothetical protein
MKPDFKYFGSVIYLVFGNGIEQCHVILIDLHKYIFMVGNTLFVTHTM